jgi:hypothetical protein
MGGATTTRNKKFFQDRQNFLYIFKIIYDPLIFANNRFSKIRSIITAGMALCVNLGPKCQNLFPLVSD